MEDEGLAERQRWGDLGVGLRTSGVNSNADSLIQYELEVWTERDKIKAYMQSIRIEMNK